ncbi:MAG: GNAT family N-acetyltransferase [Bacteroidia bacterium]
MMSKSNLSVREITKEDISPLVDYWMNSPDEFLTNMGVDLSKVPSREDFIAMIETQVKTPYPEKKSFAVIWFLDGKAIGHSNIGPVVFGEEANVHLHIWNEEHRGKGFGLECLRKSILIYFNLFKLKRIYCEPYALNTGSNKTVEKLGFDFVKEYTTIPGWICFEQSVKRWVLTQEKFDSMNHV